MTTPNEKDDMFTADAARIIGITPRQLRSFIRSTGTYAGSGSRYEFSHEEVEKLNKLYWSRHDAQVIAFPQQEFTGTDGLPIDWLRDKQHEAEFLAERQARVERMNKRLREVGLSVPQMTDKHLAINMRALASALLSNRIVD